MILYRSTLPDFYHLVLVVGSLVVAQVTPFPKMRSATTYAQPLSLIWEDASHLWLIYLMTLSIYS